MQKKINGFSLVELLVVIAIIAVLAAVAIPSYKTYVTRTNIASAFPLINSYVQDVINDYAQTSSMPTTLSKYTPYYSSGPFQVFDFNLPLIKSVYHWKDSSLNRVNLVFVFQSTAVSSSQNSVDVSIACNSKDICKIFCGWYDASTQGNDIDINLLPSSCQIKDTTHKADAFAGT